MQSPPAEWALGIGYLVTIDIIRAHGDADKDTLSEVIRDLVDRHPRGRTMFAVVLTLGALGFHRHIVRPLTQPANSAGEYTVVSVAENTTAS